MLMAYKSERKKTAEGNEYTERHRIGKYNEGVGNIGKQTQMINSKILSGNNQQ